MRKAEAEWRKVGRRLSTRLLLRACDRVGADAWLQGRPRIVNEGRIDIGARFRFSAEPVLSHLLAEHGGSIEIGDDVSIGHGSGVAARGSIRIGNGSRFGAFLLAMDTDYHVPGNSQAAAEVNPIRIGTNVRVGNRVTILRGSVIGDGATVLDGSVVTGVVPPGVRVSGVPARVTHGGQREHLHEPVALRVQRVAQQAFRLAELPPLTTTRGKLEAWDSLGSLSLLLALEEEFGVVLGEDQMRDVQTLLEASSVISAARSVS